MGDTDNRGHVTRGPNFDVHNLYSTPHLHPSHLISVVRNRARPITRLLEGLDEQQSTRLEG